MAWYNDWGKKCTITISDSLVGSGSLSYFPILLTKNTLPSEMLDANGDYKSQSDGGDIRIYNGDYSSSNPVTENTDRIPIEIVEYTQNNDPTSATVEIWARIPYLISSADSIITIYYNAIGKSQPNQSADYGKEQTWNENGNNSFVMVHHLNGSSLSAITDSTQYNNDVYEVNGIPEYNVNAKFGKGINFETSNQDYLKIVDSDSLDCTSAITITVMFKPESNIEGAFVSRSNGSYIFNNDSIGNFNFGSNAVDEVRSISTISPGVWYYLAAVRNSPIDYLYKNGVLDNSATTNDFSKLTSDIYIGGNVFESWNWFLDGILEEVRVSNVARSTQWLLSEYENMNSPSDYITLGTPIFNNSVSVTYSADSFDIDFSFYNNSIQYGVTVSASFIELNISDYDKIQTSLFSDYADEYSMGNGTNIPQNYIRKCSSSYNSERKLFDNLITEAYNMHGVCMQYYIVTYDTDYDKIFGEDNNRRFERKFEFMAYYNLPREEKLWTKFGITNMDEFSMFISKLHFKDASTYGNDAVKGNTGYGTYASYFPKVGDIIMADYNNFIYEVVEVKEEQGMFLLSKQHVIELIVKPFKNEHFMLSADTSASMTYLSAYTDESIEDVFNIKTEISNEVTAVDYSPKSNEKSDDNYFGSW